MGLGLWGLIVGIVGVAVGVIAIVQTKRSQQQPTLIYTMDHRVIFSPKEGSVEADLVDDGLALVFGGAEIPELSRSIITIRCTKGLVEGGQFSSADPLRLLIESDALLRSRIISSSARAINPSVGAPRPDGLPITFDFLNIFDEFAIEIILKTSQKPRLVGTLKGADIRQGSSAPGSQARKSDTIPVHVLITLLALLAGVAGGIYFHKNDPTSTCTDVYYQDCHPDDGMWLLGGSFSAIGTYIALYVAYGTISAALAAVRYIIKILIPKILKFFVAWRARR